MAREKTGRNIVLAGAYGIQNAGDDAPLLVLKDGLALKDSQLRVVARHVLPFDHRYFGVRFLKNPEYENRREAAGKWFRGMNPADDTFGLRRIRAAIKNSDLLVLGAGNAFIDVAIDTLKGPVPLFALYYFFAELYGRPIMLYGLSVGPLNTAYGRDLARWMLESATVVTVRDECSRDYARNVLKVRRPIHALPDPVLGVEKVALDDKNPSLSGMNASTSKYTIGLGLRDVARLTGSQTQKHILEQLATFMDAWRTKARFVLIPNSTYPEDDDRKIAADLQQMARGCEVICLDDRLQPGQIISVYEACDLAVTIRLHAAVFAVMAGVPVIGIAYLPKVRGFFETLETGGECLNVEEVTVGRLIRHGEFLLSRRKQIKDYFQRYLEHRRVELRRYFELAETAMGGSQNREQIWRGTDDK